MPKFLLIEISKFMKPKFFNFIKTEIRVVLISLVILFWACETHHDPFSALNMDPKIQTFRFSADSLKYKKSEPFKLLLKYQDDEKQMLTATFTFRKGHGDLFHSSFRKLRVDLNSITFEAPGVFDGEINFIPDSTGKLELDLELSDKVKLASARVEAFFYFNLRPVAKFTYRLQTSVSPYELDVDAADSYDPDTRTGSDQGKIEWFQWWFDDGTPWINTKANTYHHVFKRSGTYTVKLRVIDFDGGIDSLAQAIATNNQPPLAILQVDPVAGEAPVTIRYTATNSTDPDGRIVDYRIDFDDGSSSLDSAGAHVYHLDGNYRVRLKVQDNLGQTDTTGISVKVATHPRAFLNVTPLSGPFPLDCMFHGKTSYDPQGGKLKHDLYINGELRYNNIDSVIHTFDAPEKYIVRLVVTNQRNGLTAEAQQSVTVINLKPKANFNWEPQSPQHRTPVTYTSTTTDSNVTDEISYYKWTFPEGVTEEGANKNIVTHAFDAGFSTYSVKLEVWDKYRGTKFEGYSSITKIIPKSKY
ncbi:PKD domain-containing protein [candidate division KSB1 bacterium]|nr:PKD domain-containing protein [candidate division KSB1 bacterium]